MKIPQLHRPLLTKRRKVIALVLLGAVLFIALLIWIFKPKAADPPWEYQVTKGDIELSVLATGEVRPENRLEVKPPLTGRIDEVLVNEGEEVKAGQVLAWMSSNERAALLDAARAKGRAEVEHWQQLYRPIPVVAPISGTIIYRNVEAGQTFDTATPIFALSDHLLIKAQVDETDLAQIHLNQQARVTLDAYPNEPLMGRVHKISYDSKMVNNVTTYSVDVMTNKAPDFMRSGMTTTVAFISETRRDVLRIPTEAIQTKTDGHYVVVKGRGGDGKQKIEIGMTDGKFTEVTAGLTVKDIVLAPRLPHANNRRLSTNPFGMGGTPSENGSNAAPSATPEENPQ